MATTPKGIYYPNDYNEIADIPEDMKKMAESIDGVFENTDSDLSDIKEEQTTQNNRLNSLEVDNTTNKSDILTNKQEINNIKTEQTEQNTNISTNATNIESLQEENENLKKIVSQLPQVPGQGTSVTLENTIEATFTKFDVEGNSDQESTKGYQLFNNGTDTKIQKEITSINNNGLIILNGTNAAGSIYGSNNSSLPSAKKIATLPAGTYTLKMDKVSGNLTTNGGICAFYIRDGKSKSISEYSINSNTQTQIKTLTLTEETDIYLEIFINVSDWVFNNYTLSFTLVSGTEARDFEPYTGGIASPNPNYEQPIKSAGDNGSINKKILNKNLWSSIWEQGYINTNGVNENSSDFLRTKDYIYFEPEQKYAIKRSIATAYINVRGYDKNKKFIGAGSNVIVSYSGGADNPMQATIQTCVIATKPGVYYLRFNDASNNLSTEYMMVKGDTPEDYIPHKEQDYSIFVQQPMRSIGDVRDIFFKNTVDSPYYDENLTLNGWYERHYFGEVNQLSVLVGPVAQGFYFIPQGIKQGAKLLSTHQQLGTKTESEEWQRFDGSQMKQLYPTAHNGVYINYKADTKQEQINWWNSLNNILLYELAEPLDLPCTEEQIQQLENKPSTYKDFTIIQSQDETEAYLEVSGIRDINTMFDKVTNAIVSLGGNV